MEDNQLENIKGSSFSAKESETEKKRATTAKITSYLDIGNPEELSRKIYEKIGDENKREERNTSFKIRKLKIPKGASEMEVRMILDRYVGEYALKVDEIKKEAEEQIRLIKDWIESKGLFLSQDIDEIEIKITDRLIDFSLNGDEAEIPDSMFNYKRNIILIDAKDFEPGLLAHEFAHALSFSDSAERVGFREIIGKEELGGNSWLDEGAAILFELEITEKQKTPNRKSLSGLYEDGYLWLTKIFMNEIGITQDDFLRAYFGQEEYRIEIERKTRERFGCGISELDDLFLGFSGDSKKMITDIISGKSVVLSSISGSGVDKSHSRLTKVFTNIKLEIKNENMEL